MDFGLTPQQLVVISALSSGASFTAAAEQAGVHRNTITNWCRSFLPFQLAFTDAQHDRALYYREKMESLVDLAVESLQQLLADAKTPPSVRLKAALAIISSATTPPTPKGYITVDLEKIVASQSTAQTVTEPPLAPAPELHNSAQSRPPASRVPVARNAPCPCGSGRKYKACCLKKTTGKVTPELIQNFMCAA